MARPTDSGRPVVILGGAGYLGTVVARRFAAEGLPVRVFDTAEAIGRSSGTFPGSVGTLAGDFHDRSAVRAAISDAGMVLHFVGTTIPETSMTDVHFDLNSNVVPTVQLLEILCETGMPPIVFASSGGAVYGVTGDRSPIREDHPTHPISAYGVSKLLNEKYIQLFAHNMGLPALILRFGNPYGPHQPVNRSQGAVSVFLDLALRELPIVVWGDGSVVRDYLYEDDLAEAVFRLTGIPKVRGVFNIGSGEGTSISEVLSLVGELTGARDRVEYRPVRQFDVPYNVLSIEKMAAVTGWRPAYSLRDGMVKTIGSMREKAPRG